MEKVFRRDYTIYTGRRDLVVIALSNDSIYTENVIKIIRKQRGDVVKNYSVIIHSGTLFCAQLPPNGLNRRNVCAPKDARRGAALRAQNKSVVSLSTYPFFLWHIIRGDARICVCVHFKHDPHMPPTTNKTPTVLITISRNFRKTQTTCEITTRSLVHCAKHSLLYRFGCVFE